MRRNIIFFLVLLTCLCGCSYQKSNNQQLSKSGIYFDTFVTITVYGDYDEAILNECFDKCKDYENLFSRTISTSDVSKINTSKGEPVKVNSETIELIQKGIYYGDLSEGLFDITIAPVSEMWDFHDNKEGIIPDDNQIKKALEHVSYKQIEINEKELTVALKDQDAKIDLGGIAKGYIADKLKEFLLSKGVKSALINLGGNIEAIGCKPDGKPFVIGIKKPFHENEIETQVEINDNSVATSGVYERYFYYDDRFYHHIINPMTGYPVETDLYGVSIIADSSIDSDALGTICVLMGYEKANQLIDSIEGVNAIWSFAQ